MMKSPRKVLAPVLAKKICNQMKVFVLIASLVFSFMIALDRFGTKMKSLSPKPIFKEHLNEGILPRKATCRDILEISDTGISEFSKLSNLSKIVLEEISYDKQHRNFVYYEYYNYLSQSVPSMLINVTSGNGTNTSINKKTPLELLDYKIPYLKCKLKNYANPDIISCLKKKLDHSETFHISFIGDSKIRTLMEAFLEVSKDLDLTITTRKGDQLTLNDFLGKRGNIFWPKYKESLSVTSSLYSNFRISYYWAPYLSRGDLEDKLPYYQNFLKSNIFSYLFKPKLNRLPVENEIDFMEKFATVWNKNKTVMLRNYVGKRNGAFDELHRISHQKVLPDYIILDSGSWEMRDIENFSHNIDSKGLRPLKKLYKILEDLASRTNLIFMLPEPFKEYFPKKVQFFSHYHIQKTSNLAWYFNAQLQMLPINVIRWDSFIPFALASTQDCLELMLNKNVYLDALPNFKRFTPDYAYKCLDKIHIGYETLNIAVQMLLNQFCNNKLENKSISYCCDSS